MLLSSKRTNLFLCLSLACTFVDQVTKLLAQLVLSEHTPLPLLDQTLRFQIVFNQGGLGSIGAASATLKPSFIVAWSVFMLCVLLACGLRSKTANVQTVTAAALIFSGGLGNLMDRVFGGAVVDFINLNVAGLRSAIFNFADVFIVSGFLVLLTSILLQRKPASGRHLGQQA